MDTSQTPKVSPDLLAALASGDPKRFARELTAAGEQDLEALSVYVSRIDLLVCTERWRRGAVARRRIFGT